MKRRLLTLTASALILTGGMGLAQAQQSTGDRPTPPPGQPGQQGPQGPGMMGPGMGMNPEMMQMMQHMMGEQQGRMGMGPGMMGPGMMGQGGGAVRIMFAIMDADGNRALSLAEVQDIHARIFQHIDADRNGEVTLEEIQAFFRGMEPASDPAE